jgi:hypothetical protein
MPTKADTLVVAFRTWLDTVGGGGPFGPLPLAAGYPQPITSRRELLDRYHQHTASCSSCSKVSCWTGTISIRPAAPPAAR